MTCGTRALLFLICLLCLPGPPVVSGVPDETAAVPPQRPLQTVLPWTLERGQWEIGAGLLRRDGVSPPFFSDAPATLRSEWRASLVDATLGLGGGGEVQLRFGVQRFHENGGSRQSGIEDARIAFTYQLPVRTLSTALRFEVKLPNAPNDNRLGTDQTDIFMVAAVGQRRERWGWAGNLGFGILGDPLEAAVQDDVMLFGAAGWYTPGRGSGPVTLLGEVGGMAASRFGNDFRIARAGARFGRRVPLDLSVRRGLTAPSEDWGIEAGVTLFCPAQGQSRRARSESYNP
jgi:hypothetical protein